MIGYKTSKILGLIEFYTFFIGSNLTFFPHHILGLLGMPRRYVDYPIMYKKWHIISTIGSIITLISMIIFIIIIYKQLINKYKYKNYIKIRNYTLDEVHIKNYHHYNNNIINIKYND